MYNIDAVQQNNLNFTSLKSIKYRKAGIKEYKARIQNMLGAEVETKSTLIEKIVSRFFPKSALNYRLHGIKEMKKLSANA